MKFMRRALPFIAGILLLASPANAAWPSVSARTKTWGAEVLTASDLQGQFDLIHTYINAMMNGTTGHGHTGSTNDGPKLNIAAALTIASQAQGDVIYASSGSAWARLGAGTAGQFLKTNGASANPAWSNVVITNYRREMLCAQASATTLTVSPGELEVNGQSIVTTSATTLTLTNAANWAGGVSLQGTSTYAYIGVDSSGNMKMHTTAPSNCEYALSTTAGIKRYVSWSSTTYRVIGWFYMNSTGSGELNAWEVGNLKDAGVPNTATQSATASVTVNDTSYGTDLTSVTHHFYSTGRPVSMTFSSKITRNAADTLNNCEFNIDTSGDSSSERQDYLESTGHPNGNIQISYQKTLSQGVHTIYVEAKVGANQADYTNRTTIIDEK